MQHFDTGTYKNVIKMKNSVFESETLCMVPYKLSRNEMNIAKKNTFAKTKSWKLTQCFIYAKTKMKFSFEDYRTFIK